jgi:hypothetical protein
MAPKKVTVKVLTVNKPAKQIFDFFSDVRNMEIGGDDDWWNFDHIIAGKGRIKVVQVRDFGILDHEFVGAGLEWKVYV